MPVAFDADRGALRFPALGAVRHCVATRLDGVSGAPFARANLGLGVPDDPAAVAENRRRLAARLGLGSQAIVNGAQVHGTAIAEVRAGDGTVPATDALITTDPEVALLTLTADCAALVLYAPDAGAIGVAHLGWRGTVGRLGEQLARRLIDGYGADPSSIVGAIAPAIGPCCYVVGPEIVAAVRKAFRDPDPLIRQDGGAPIFDIPAAILQQLGDAGVDSVEDSGLCTACRTDLFFSHRAEQGRTGRHGLIVALPA